MDIKQQFGRFEIKALLGDGAMGKVYRAHDPTLKRDVAIKVIKFPENLHAEHVNKIKQDLLKEARLAACLSHPGIVQVYDVDEQNNNPFLVLELISGTLLSQFIKDKGALDMRTAQSIFLNLLSAMAYAHHRGVIHLDLKPANIILEQGMQPRIMDFGIAHSASELTGNSVEIAGTPLYMSPEQIGGKNVDPRSDVYSLGVILYQMLSGRLPFFSKNFNALRESIINKLHTPLQVYKADLPKPYLDFIDRTLRKIPADRFDSAISMHEEFKKCTEEVNSSKTHRDDARLTGKAKQNALYFITQRMKRKGDFPAASEYIVELTSKIRSKNASSQHVAQTILKDVSLTNRVLRIANSAYYKVLGEPVTTISRAVVMLGMNAILNMASALTIFEHFLKGSDTDELKNQVLQAILTALYAREIADKIKSINSEEPFICGMLHHLGILIVSFYFPEEQKAINSLMLDEKMDKEKASRKIMRLSYTDLSQAVSDSWGLPELIKNGIIRMNPDRKGPLKDKIEAMQCITSYAYELSHAVMITDTSKRIQFARLARRFEDKISITTDDLEIITNNSLQAASGFSETIRLQLEALQLIPGGNTAIDIQEAFNEAENLPTFNKKNITAPPDTRNAAIQSNHAVNNNSVIAEQLEFLSKTITDITTTITGTFSISDVIMMVLEGMSRGLGMHHVLLSMVTPQRDRLSFSCGLGPATDHLRTTFDFPMTSSSDAPVVCIKNRQEIFISDFEADSQSPLIPEALVHLLHPQSIVFLPVLMQNAAIGLVMATRSKEQMPINNLELQSMRMLVNQFVLAIHQSRIAKK
jgi:serine/threonine protein kinase